MLFLLPSRRQAHLTLLRKISIINLKINSNNVTNMTYFSMHHSTVYYVLYGFDKCSHTTESVLSALDLIRIVLTVASDAVF